MATVISVANQKGGPGKTTTAINVGGALISAGYRLTIIDTDRQASFWKWNRTRTRAGLTPFPVITVPEGMLAEEIQRMRTDPEIDIVLIDCPGNIAEITQAAVEASDAVLCPVRATWVDFDATKEMAKLVEGLQQKHPDMKYMIFHSCTHGARNMDKRAKENMSRVFARNSNVSILETQIPDSAVLAEFGGAGETVFEYAPKSPAARLYKKMTKEVIACLTRASA
jgi:chromosome partitioning protein